MAKPRAGRVAGSVADDRPVLPGVDSRRVESYHAPGLYRSVGGLVVDRLHVAIHSRDAVDTLRQTECRRLHADRPPKRAVPTAALWPWLRREWRSLNPDQPGKVVALFQQIPALARA